MPKDHEKFYSSNGKRQILVADDEMINREMLREMLSGDYEIIFAEDGAAVLEIMRAKKLVTIISGSNKAEAARKLLVEDVITPRCPVTLVKAHPDSTVIITRALAEQIGYKG